MEATQPSSFGHDHDDREQPDEELRRQDLAESDERDGGRCAHTGRTVPPSSVSPRAYRTQTKESAATPTTVVIPDAAPATEPVRFCDPDPDAQARGIPAALCSASSTLEPRLSIWSGLPSCRQTLRATPSGATRANGR